MRVVNVVRHWRNNHPVKAHERIMSVKGSKAFKNAVNLVAKDAEIRELTPNINIREVKRIGRGENAGVFFPMKSKQEEPGVNIAVDSRDPAQSLTVLHELGHAKSFKESGFKASSETFADSFAMRKAKELGIDIGTQSDRRTYPPSYLLPISKQERRFIRRSKEYHE